MFHTSFLGNDVVDLGDPWTAARHTDVRFVARVCGEHERARLAVAADPRSLLWAMFAAKEAAYKAVCKLGPRPVFAHRAFEVAADLASVRFGDCVLALRVSIDGDRVHAVAWTGDEPAWSVCALPAGADPSERARALLCESAGRALRCSPEALRVHRDPIDGSWDGYGPPRLERYGATVPVDVSLSHDGRFVACAHSYVAHTHAASARV